MTGLRTSNRAAVIVFLAMVLSACGDGAEAPPASESELSDATGDTLAGATRAADRVPSGPDSMLSPNALVDPGIETAAAGEEGWEYFMSTDVDLTGDGTAERAVIAARVEVHEGRPAWDDGQPWHVYVEAADSSRTTLYAQRLQLGTLTMRASLGGSQEQPTLLLIEHLPDRIRIFEVLYRVQDEPTIALRLERALDPRGDLASPQLPSHAPAASVDLSGS